MQVKSRYKVCAKGGNMDKDRVDETAMQREAGAWEGEREARSAGQLGSLVLLLSQCSCAISLVVLLPGCYLHHMPIYL